MQKFFSQFNNLSKYLIAAVLVIVPLYPKFPFIRIPGIYVSVRLEDFLLLALGIITLIKVIPRIQSFLGDKVVRAFLIFFAVGVVSIVAGALLSQTVSFSIAALHLLRRVEYAIPLFAIFVLFDRAPSHDLGFYIKILAIVVSVAFVYGIGQRYFNFPIIDTQNDEYSKGIALFWTPGAHINSTFAGHYDLAAFMVMVLPIFSTLAFLTNKWRLRIMFLTVTFAGLWLLGASLSRISLISWVVAASVPLILIRKYKAILLVLFAAAVVVMLFPSFLGRYQRFLDVYAAEATPTPVPVFEDRSTSIRLNVEWPAAIRAFEKNPLIGTGYSSIGLAADNDYLRALAEVGILGLVAFLIIFVYIGKEFYRFVNSGVDKNEFSLAFIYGMLGATVGTFVTAAFIDIFEASKFATIFWLLIGYAVFLIKNRSNEQEN